MTEFPQEFTLAHIFKDYQKIPYCELIHGETEDHFGVSWRIVGFRNFDGMYVHLECLKSSKTAYNWNIDADLEFFVLRKQSKTRILLLGQLNKSPNWTNHVFSNEAPTTNRIQLVNLRQWILIHEQLDGKDLKVEISMKINKMEGIQTVLRRFDEPTKELSDVVLVVKDQKFHVQKKYLCLHSPYFQSLFSGRFLESTQSEIELKEVDPYVFQKFLELIHGFPAVDDDTVEKMLELGDFFQSEAVLKNCEEFLIKYSEKSVEMKYRTSLKYKMEGLKKKSFTLMRSASNIRSIVESLGDELSKEDCIELMLNAMVLKK